MKITKAIKISSILLAVAVSAVAISCSSTPPPEEKPAPVPVAEPVASAPESVPEDEAEPGEPASVLVLVRDASEEHLFRDALAPIRESVAAQLTAVGVDARSLDFVQSDIAGTDEAAFEKLSPAEACTLAGTDYAFVIRLAEPIEFTHEGTDYTRLNASYSLVSGTGKIIDGGRGARIFSARSLSPAHREMLAADTSESLATVLAEKISEKKVRLVRKASVAFVEAEFVCVLEAVTFPQIAENADGTYSLRELRGSAAISGATLRIGGIDYHLSANGEPTRIAVPQNRPFAVSLTHHDLRPERRVLKVASAGEKIVIPVVLSDAARERFADDMLEISEAIKDEAREDALSDATVALIRGKAKFWENSGILFSQSVSRNITHEEKTAISEELGEAGTATTPAEAEADARADDEPSLDVRAAE